MEKVLMKGNEALAEAAIMAGCRHYYGYPITPQTEVAAYMAKRMPKIGGVFLQAESEIAAINMVIGTSAIVDTELDGAVGMNSGIFNNPFLFWGRYRKKLFRYYLPISFQFHHTQMDGAHAGRFLANLQREINYLQ